MAGFDDLGVWILSYIGSDGLICRCQNPIIWFESQVHDHLMVMVLDLCGIGLLCRG